MSPSPSPIIDFLDLEATDQPAAPTFQTLLEKLWTARFCGAVTLHFAGGRPLAVVLQQETRIVLDTPK